MPKTQTFKYKNVTKQPQSLVGYGTVKPGKTIETQKAVHNPNFVLAGGDRLVNVEAPTRPVKANKK